MLRRILTVSLLCLGLISAGSTHAASVEEAQALVRQTTESVLQRLEQDRAALKENRDGLYGLIEDIVLPHFDFDAMSRMVLAKYWRTATPVQRERFVSEFRDLLVRTYGTALLEYTGQAINYKPVHASDDAHRVKVPTEVVPGEGGPPIPIVYSLYEKDGAWKVYDISVDGVSLLLNYRNSYSTKVRQQGLDALLDEMAEHNRGKGGGA